MSHVKSKEIEVQVKPVDASTLLSRILEALEDIRETIKELKPIEEVKSKPYTNHIFTVASEPITDRENIFDIGLEVACVIVSPSIDAKIEFDKPTSDTTPTIRADASLSAEYSVRRIFYRAANPGEQGVLNVWAFWW